VVALGCRVLARWDLGSRHRVRARADVGSGHWVLRSGREIPCAPRCRRDGSDSSMQRLSGRYAHGSTCRLSNILSSGICISMLYAMSLSMRLSVDQALVNQIRYLMRSLKAVLGDAKDANVKYSMGYWNIFCDRIH